MIIIAPSKPQYLVFYIPLNLPIMQAFIFMVLFYKKKSFSIKRFFRRTTVLFSTYFLLTAASFFCFLTPHQIIFAQSISVKNTVVEKSKDVEKNNFTSQSALEVIMPKIDIAADSISFYQTLLNYIGQRKSLTEAMMVAVHEQKIEATPSQTDENKPERATATASILEPAPYNDLPTADPTMTEIGREISYKRVLQNIVDKQTELRTRYTALKANDRERVVQELATFFNHTIAQDMRSYWIGRKLKPICKKKELTPVENTRNLVAFMLHDLGFVTDYNYIIQLAPRDVIAFLAEKNTPKYCKNVVELNEYLSKKGNGIYIVSFDKYMGIINYNGINIYLYVADPGNNGKIAEFILNDKAKQEFMFPFFNVAAFTYNTELLKKWLVNKAL